jgi:hypothetical protein
MRKTRSVSVLPAALGVAKRAALALSPLLVLAMLAAPASAVETLHLSCTGSTACTGGSVSQITQSTTVTFDVTQADHQDASGEAFIAVLIPNGTASLTTTVGGGSPLSPVQTVLNSTNSFGGTLGLSGVTDKNFSTLKSFSAQAGVTANSFSYYEYDLGSFTGTPSTLISNVSVGVLPPGAIIIAFTTSSSTSTAVTDISPNSESLTVVPESSSLLLFGLGVLALGFIARRRLLPSEDSDSQLAV